MNRYLFMDQESKNRRRRLDFLELLPEMVVTTMCAQRVTMVNDAIHHILGIDLLNSYVFRDLDLQNWQ
jgi:hypothetical protein